MSGKIKLKFLFVLIVFVGSLLQAQQVSYKPGQYPAPRYPEIPKNPTVEDLMPTARTVVKRGDIGAMFYPGYEIKPGERALLAVARHFDPLVLEAIQRAIREAGGKVDVLIGNDSYLPGGDGATEWQYFTFMKDIMDAQAGGIDQATIIDMTLAGKYDIAISGMGGGIPPHPQDKMRWAYMPWDLVDQFLVHGAGIPPDLLKFIDNSAWDTLTKAVSIHATDPEGTDITWSTKSEIWQRPDLHNPGHLSSHPSRGGATGVLAGTWNHIGPFPHIRASFKNDRLEGIEGGGAYGQKWRAVRDQWKDVSVLTKPGPGLFIWLQEASVGTNPKSLRPKDALKIAMGNIWERTRSGVLHWGIGGGHSEESSTVAVDNAGGQSSNNFVLANPSLGDSPLAEFYVDHPDTPTGHVHIHNYFVTMELTDANGGKIAFIDKGHLTVLDDPKVRQEAAKYGDPDELLRESWIPAVPGINVPGDYRKDYASDPVSFVRKDLANWSY